MSNEKDNLQGLHIGLVWTRLSFFVCLFVCFLLLLFFFVLFCFFFFKILILDKQGFEAECGRVYKVGRGGGGGGGVLEKTNTKLHKHAATGHFNKLTLVITK